jgi:hypothetical protein
MASLVLGHEVWLAPKVWSSISITASGSATRPCSAFERNGPHDLLAVGEAACNACCRRRCSWPPTALLATEFSRAAEGTAFAAVRAATGAR